MNVPDIEELKARIPQTMFQRVLEDLSEAEARAAKGNLDTADDAEAFRFWIKMQCGIRQEQSSRRNSSTYLI